MATRMDLFPNEQNFDLDKSRQKFHHSLKEHHVESASRVQVDWIATLQMTKIANLCFPTAPFKYT